MTTSEATDKPTKPEDFGTTDCGDGITISKVGSARYHVHRDGRFLAGFPTNWAAIQYVADLKAND